jgi:ATP-dependent RNA helicase MSS116
VPSQREQYIHRLGRTARAGKSGEGVIVLDPREDFFIHKVGLGGCTKP